MRKPTISMLKMLIRALRRDGIYSPVSMAVALNHIEAYQIDIWAACVIHSPLSSHTEVKWLNHGRIRSMRYDLYSEVSNIIEILAGMASNNS